MTKTTELGKLDHVHQFPCLKLLVVTAEQCLLFYNISLLLTLIFHAFHLLKQKSIPLVSAHQTGCTIGLLTYELVIKGT